MRRARAVCRVIPEYYKYGRNMKALSSNVHVLLISGPRAHSRKIPDCYLEEKKFYKCTTRQRCSPQGLHLQNIEHRPKVGGRHKGCLC